MRFGKLGPLTKFIDPALVSFGNLASNIMAGFFWFYLATVLGVEDYGHVNYSIAIASVASTISLIGLNTTVTTYKAKGIRVILEQANLLVLILGSIASILVAFLLNDISTAILIVGLNSFAMTLADALGLKKYKHFALLIIANRASQVMLSLVLYYVIGLQGIILGFAIPSLVLGYHIFSLRKESFSIGEIRPRSRFVFHSYSLSLSQVVVGYADKLIITSIFGLTTLGSYQLGFQFLMFLSVIPASLYQYLLPNEASGTERKAIRKVGLLLAILLAIIFYLVSPYAINSFFPKYTASISAAQTMAFGIIPLTINSIMNSRFLGSEKSKPVLFGAVVYVAALVSLLYSLGNIFGLIGLGFAVVASLSLQSLTLWIFSKPRLSLSNRLT